MAGNPSTVASRWDRAGVLAAAAVAALGLVMLMAPGRAAAVPDGVVAAGPAGGSPLSTATLPPLPNVSPAYTDGRPGQKLLDNAVRLSSIGAVDAPLRRAVDATQARLDADAVAARNAEDQLAEADGRASAARARETEARAKYRGTAGAVRQALIFLYTSGPEALTVNPRAGALALYAQDYADSTLGPLGVLARRRTAEQQMSAAAQDARVEADAATAAAARAARAVRDQHLQLLRLRSELAAASVSDASSVAADHAALAAQAGKELLAHTSLQFSPKDPLPPPVSTTPVALTWAFAELGKPYVWGATGPDSFDCSGLTQFVWKQAGVVIPRVAADQDAWAVPVPLSQLLPGDLVFFGTTNIHHVGMYIGDGLMINAPHTGTVVQVSSIWWSDLAGFGRVHYPGTPVPPHQMPTPSRPAAPTVVASAGPVPSQTRPPAGWKPGPGSTTPIRLSGHGADPPGASASTTLADPGTVPEGAATDLPTTSTTSPPDTTSTSSTSPPDSTSTIAPGSTTTTTSAALPGAADGGVAVSVPQPSG